jgi:ubiquinone/menaquinone biosynthesis C-methylase UbiE/DNA-binding transcriptional ArsR family regulator
MSITSLNNDFYQLPLAQTHQPNMSEVLAGLSAAADPTRLRLLWLLSQAELTVTELTQILEQSQPRLSRHLKIMVEAGLLDRFRDGAYVFFRLALDGWNTQLAHELVRLLPPNDHDITHDRLRLIDIQADRAQWATDYFTQNAPQWDQLRSLYLDELQVEERLLKLLPNSINRALDIGTGTGRMLQLLAPRTKQLIGIDNSPSMLDIARKTLDDAKITNASLHRADMYQLPWSGPIFDVVLLHQVLHFAEEPSRVIAQAKRVIATNGFLVIADFAPHTEESLRTLHGHRRLGFSDKEIANWCTQAGLTLEKTEHLYSEPLTVCLWVIRPNTPNRHTK